MRLLLIQFCTVLSLGAFSQKIAPDNKVLIENFPAAASTYSIDLQFSNGEKTSLGSSKVYIAAIFPQLDKLKSVKENGDIIVTVQVGEEIDIATVRTRPELSKMLADYNRFEPVPGSSPAGKAFYFQPLTLSFQMKGSSFFTLRSLGKLLQRSTDTNRPGFDKNSKEKTGALTSLEFLRAHIFKLSGEQE